jgi:lipopolysaccharide export system protein LptA
MKIALLFLGVFGLAIIAGGQTSVPVQKVRITAARVVQDSDTVHYRGNVEISVGNAVVVADEVDVPVSRYKQDGASNPIELRGGVHLSFENGVPVLIER